MDYFLVCLRKTLVVIDIPSKGAEERVNVLPTKAVSRCIDFLSGIPVAGSRIFQRGYAKH